MTDFREQLRWDFRDYQADAVAPLSWFLPETHEETLANAHDDTFDRVEQVNSENPMRG